MKRKVNSSRLSARLVLEDGSEFFGLAFGKARSQAGEVVFTTGMTGYPQSLTDPSYRGQILVATYPLIGNYGVPLDIQGNMALDAWGIPIHFESHRIQVAGFVVADLCEEPSHFASGATLSQWMEKQNVVGISGIDTRALTERLREHGVMRGKILVEGSRDVTFDSGDIAHPVAEVSPKEVQIYSPQSMEHGAVPRIALLDCGAKANILRVLLSRGVEVIRLPWDHDLSDIEYDGLFLSNGPGDPKACAKTIATVRRALQDTKPIFGICLGNQLMALAAGADTYKLPYGHRGQNQPCRESGTERCYITSQNHGYAVREDTLPRNWKTWFENANDGTVEGIRSEKGLFRAVQFHPEGCPGPRDTEFLIDAFIQDVKRNMAGGK
ncbi:glutamine-hydrolyzing carbamoyl-phosphate synthase small subunit [Gracilinema caldarium]|uniref:Carbamoyl phosphate synthase small chain n=1 Tax=Gracilinema caldarium (strain ATCC 51460 / DSM 7334 / H1) TaxID=744872 RepID=F8F1H7_GRAC1|nr:glutamine-hydrolyzing carbamoyl-phosphate synthase small subunit [Gracilinema caldarium]AEJ19030.1 carbamoyl-phosphate synthase, small subunit [Gracilinema caldarium DSM 7334]